jgi:uncharacterized damage-inducible protein DinB
MSSQTMIFWRYITSSIEQLLGSLDELSTEEMNWVPLPNANSLYVLATHTLGTTAENLLKVLCGQPVHRQREAEFAAQGTSTAQLHTQWESLRDEIRSQLEQLDDASLEQVRQHPRRGNITGLEVLIIVARHCAEHMGQAALTRDLILTRRGETPAKRQY